MKRNKIVSIFALISLCLCLFVGCADIDFEAPSINTGDVKLLASEYAGEPFVVVNNNVPYFSDEDKSSTEVFETYSKLDSLGRCGVAYANVCKKLMPTEDRESLSSVTPSGWKNKQYDFVDGGWLYNRAHIIGFQLAGEQANEKNLITGTRYFNVEGMLPFENMVADYVKETNGHVLYRVTPIYEGKNLVAEGVLMEGWSIEDDGESICFNVFCYNVQPGVEIDYATGDSWESGTKVTTATQANGQKQTYILNTNSKKFHKEGCGSANDISAHNKEVFTGTHEELINQGYQPCGSCKP